MLGDVTTYDLQKTWNKNRGQLSYQEMRVFSKVLHAEHNSFVMIPTNKVTCELELMVLPLQVV